MLNCRVQKSGKFVRKFIDHKNHNVNKYFQVSLKTHLWVKLELETGRCKRGQEISQKP